MSRLTTMVIVLALVGGTAAVAQTGGAGSTKPPTTIPQAPIGHRQPTKADVPTGGSQDNSGLLGAGADDKALDRKIKSICRGC